MEPGELENYFSTRSNKRGLYLYSKDGKLFKLVKVEPMLKSNKILFVNIKGNFFPYDPRMKMFSDKDLYIKDKLGNY